MKTVPIAFLAMGTVEGEWSALLRTENENRGNTDGHLYYRDLGDSLERILINKPKYYLGMQRFAREETHKEPIEKFLKENDLENLNWVNADVFHHASIKGYFEQFFDVLRKRDEGVILVGPKYLMNLGQFFNVFIEVPEKNCWLAKDQIVSFVKAQLEEAEKNVVVLFVASMSANVMVDELYNEYGNKHTFIDAGSVFDPYCGVSKRGYHKKVIERLKANENK